ncbi:MAG: outer membrane beta-barrel protein [Bacteroidota bacterium]
MKKIISAVVFAMIVFGFSMSYAQLSKGNWILGVSSDLSASISTSKVNGTKSGSSKSFYMSPKAAYFFMDKLAGGLVLNLNTYSGKYSDDSKDKSIGFSAGPWFRYYLPCSYMSFKPFAQLEGVYGMSKSTYKPATASESKYNYTDMSFDVLVGASCFFNQHVALDASLGYSNFREKEKSSGDKYAGSGFQFEIGLSVFLGQK